MAHPIPADPGPRREIPAGEPDRNAIRFSAWNLLLIVPLLMLITSWFNHDGPRLFGMPFFYWYQFAFVFVGVACVAIVHLATRHLGAPGTRPGLPANPDEGDAALDRAGTDR